MRGLLVLAALALATLAGANAVMGVALEQYDRRAWLAYVILTVAFEAWAIGRKIGFEWPAAVGVSIAANFVTAGCCANLCGVGLHTSFVGSGMNPNPLMNMVVMFTVFAVISGWIEAVVWRLFKRKADASFENRVVLRSVGAHLAWVPLGIAIMLVPSRPYPYLEAYTIHARGRYLYRLREALNSKLAQSGRVPDYRDTVRLFHEIVPLDGPPDPDSWVMPYRPDFSRFATGQTRGELLWEWNPAATGLKIDSDKMLESIWLLRMRRREDWGTGFVLKGGTISVTRSRSGLGYDKIDASIVKSSP